MVAKVSEITRSKRGFFIGLVPGVFFLVVIIRPGIPIPLLDGGFGRKKLSTGTSKRLLPFNPRPFLSFQLGM
jgi:hypothetical protein